MPSPGPDRARHVRIAEWGLSARCWGQSARSLLQLCLVEVGDEGHDDGSDSRVKAAVVTRCLSPLGMGNDETGSDGRSGSDNGCSIEPIVAHCSPSLVGK